MRELGRNDPCWCGSGKKYKKCHRAGDAQSRPGTVAPPERNPLVLDAGQRECMRAACAFNAELMDHIRPLIVPGVTTAAIDAAVQKYTEAHGHVCACIGYRGFPCACCTSVNEVVCHGIPDGTVLTDGDIVNVDLTTIVDGWHGDSSETFLLGAVDARTRRLVQCAFDGLYVGIEAIRPYGTVNDIARAITRHAHAQRYTVVREYQGHGIGREFHQEPAITHYPHSVAGAFVIEPGMCFTIEPMINAGTRKVTVDKRDKWTVRTADGKRSAQFEHTILMTDAGPEVLTWTQNGPKPGHQF